MPEDNLLELEFMPDSTLKVLRLSNSGLRIENTGDDMFINDSTIYSSWELSSEICKIQVYSDHFIIIYPDGETKEFIRVK
ncbi:MAG: hypothetical protein JXC36_05855 [Candidatus Atribacteria bacterium]|nr:hypothetical protein [Candidatus Atribacteria bacterium]